MGITYLHCAWRLQSSGKVKRANQFLKSAIKKITQTSLRWKEALPKLSSAPVLFLRNRLVLVLMRCLYGRPFVYINDLFLDPEAQTLWFYTMAIGQFQQDICLWGVNQDPKDSKESPLYATDPVLASPTWLILPVAYACLKD